MSEEPTSLTPTVVGSGAIIELPVLDSDFEYNEKQLVKNMASSQITARKLPRLKLDKYDYVINDVDGTHHLNTFRGVILHSRTERAYWSQPIREGEKNAPDCHSLDSITGIGKPGGKCRTCPLAQFGSGRRNDGSPSRGQACRQSALLFLYRDSATSLLPELLTLPPTSLRNWNDFYNQVTTKLYHGRLMPLERLVIDFGTEPVKSGSINYSVGTFRAVGILPEERSRYIARLAEIFADIFAVPIDLESFHTPGLQDEPAFDR